MSASLFAFDLHSLNVFSITLRLVLAVVISVAIGLERGVRKHPAGFRTHILVCVGAALAMLTNQYLHETFGDLVDPGRMGAQVITGVGFLGVGTILVTGTHKIKGLTTAAGLWASACIGLAIGIGFYLGAILAGLIVLGCLALLPKIERFFYTNAKTVAIHAHVDSFQNVGALMGAIKDMDVAIVEMSLEESLLKTKEALAVNLFLKLPKDLKPEEALERLNAIPCVLLTEEPK